MNLKHTDPTDPAQLLEMVRYVTSRDGWDAANWDLHQALVRGLEEWARAKLFPRIGPQYFVAGMTDARQPMRPFVLNSLDRWSTAFGRAAPVAEQTLLLATERDQVALEPVVGQRDVLSLVVALSTPIAEQLIELTTRHPGELDLYCDATGRETLDAFHTLLQGRWPRDIGLPEGSRQVWPKLGLRPVWRMRGPQLSPGPVDLLNLNHHALEGRFARLPLEAVAPYGRLLRGRPALVIPVHLGAEARDVAARLKGRLFVNQVAFWNYRIGLVDSPKYAEMRQSPATNTTEIIVPLDDPPGTSPYVVIECWSRSPHATFVDRRWSSWVDPLMCFEVPSPSAPPQPGFETADDVRELRLRFAQDKIGENMVVVYVVAADWLANAIHPGDGVLTGSPEYELMRVRNSFAPEQDGSHLRLIEEMRLATWLAAGRRSFPDAPIITRDDLAIAVRRWLPQPLRRAVWGDRGPTALEPIENLKIWTAFRDASPGHPVTVVELAGGKDGEAENYYAEWLARTLESQCPMGTSLDVRIRTDGGD